jgi:hypothetical protein
MSSLSGKKFKYSINKSLNHENDSDLYSQAYTEYLTSKNPYAGFL